MNAEAGDLWLGQVLFCFETSKAMLDKLVDLPPTTLSQIRHVRVGGDPLKLMPTDYDGPVYYDLVLALKLLPALRLDSLTVLAPFLSTPPYDTLDALIKHGNGWRELNFIPYWPKTLDFPMVDMFLADGYCDRPQPSTWNNILLGRDDVGSGASVTIYQSTQPDTPGAIFNAGTRQLFMPRQISLPENPEDFDLSAQAMAWQSQNEIKTELLVVLKRGQHANIAENGTPPYHPGIDIHYWVGDMTGAEIRRCIDFPRVDRGEQGDEEHKVVEFDEYDGPEEYSWFY